MSMSVLLVGFLLVLVVVGIVLFGGLCADKGGNEGGMRRIQSRTGMVPRASITEHTSRIREERAERLEATKKEQEEFYGSNPLTRTPPQPTSSSSSPSKPTTSPARDIEMGGGERVPPPAPPKKKQVGKAPPAPKKISKEEEEKKRAEEEKKRVEEEKKRVEEERKRVEEERKRVEEEAERKRVEEEAKAKAEAEAAEQRRKEEEAKKAVVTVKDWMDLGKRCVVRESDDEDVWYRDIENATTSWDVGVAVVVDEKEEEEVKAWREAKRNEGGGAVGVEAPWMDLRKRCVVRESDDEDVWYRDIENATTSWDLGEDAVVVDESEEEHIRQTRATARGE